MSKDIEKYQVIRNGLGRIGHQYADSENFKAFVTSTLEPIVNLQSVFFDMLDIDIETATATDNKINLLAKLIGAPAVIKNAIPRPFFGFDDQDEGQEFGELDDPAVGGEWREMGQESNTDLFNMPAELFSKIVKAQLLKNSSRSSPDEIIKIVKTILGDDIVFRYAEAPMAILILPQLKLEWKEIQILKALVPRPFGVRFSVINDNYENITMTDSEAWQIIRNDDY